MARPTVVAVLLSLLLAGTLPLPSPSAQTGNADLTIVSLTVQDPVHGSEEPATVLATVRNLGPEATGVPGGVVHFRYNGSDRALTGDARSDQPFNLTEPLPPGAQVAVRVLWSPSEDQVGPGTVIATVESQWEPDGTQRNNDRTTNVFVTEYNASPALVDQEDRRGFPGMWTPYRVTVENVGNAPTTFDLSIAGTEDDEWTLPDGWNGTVAPESVRLAPGQTRRVVALIAPAPSAAPPDRANATFNASVRGASEFTFSVPLPETSVRDGLAPDFRRASTIEPVNNSTFIGPAPGNYTTRWTVSNEGSAPDAYTFDARLEGEAAELVRVHPVDVVAFNPGEGDTVEVTVELNESIPPGPLGILEIGVRSINSDASETAATAEMDLLGSGPNPTVTGIGTPDPLYALDENASVQVSVRNRGNLPMPPAPLDLQVVRSGFTLSRAEGEVGRLDPGGRDTVDIQIPVKHLAGSYALQVTANQPPAFNETSRGDNQAQQTLVVRTAGLSVRSPPSLSLQPEAFARYVRAPHVFEVVNLGNARESVAVVVGSEHGWIEDERTIQLDGGARAVVPIEFRIPAYPGTPSDALQVTASLVNRSSVAASNATTTTILDDSPPELLTATLPASTEALSPFDVLFELRDAVGVSSAWLIIRGPDGGEEQIELSRAGGDAFGANLSLRKLGTHVLELHAVDSAAEANKLVHPESYHVAVSYDRVPQIALASPDNAALRSGDPIKIEVHDLAGLSTVNVTSRGQPLNLGADMTVDTTDWREGRHPVEVTAVNRYGLKNATTFTITVDNTAPVIQRIDLRPQRPTPNEPATLEVEVAGASKVVGIVTHVGDETKRIPMEEHSTGVFSTRLTLPKGAYELSVEAIDEAGNAAGSDEPIHLDVRSDTSGISWLASALVLVAVGLLAGERRPKP